MDNIKLTKKRRTVASAVVAAACVGAAVVSAWCGAPPKMAAQQAMPVVQVQWQPQTLLETRFAAKIAEDNKFLFKKLVALSGAGAEMSERERAVWKEGFGNTYLSNPRLWVAGRWHDGLDNVLNALKPIVKGSMTISIDAVSAIIEYKEHAGKEKEQDIDAIARIRVTFSASPDGMILEGGLCHSRLCPIIPCDYDF
jgi:hypothetical protein